MIYALYLVVNPKFSKKKFAEVFRIAYGTARNWINDDKVNEAAVIFASDFVELYLAEVNKILSKLRGRMRWVKYVEKKKRCIR